MGGAVTVAVCHWQNFIYWIKSVAQQMQMWNFMVNIYCFKQSSKLIPEIIIQTMPNQSNNIWRVFERVCSELELTRSKPSELSFKSRLSSFPMLSAWDQLSAPLLSICSSIQVAFSSSLTHTWRSLHHVFHPLVPQHSLSSPVISVIDIQSLVLL